MAKGIIYVTTTVVDGLIKIGKTDSKGFRNRMYNLEHNGYANVTALKRFFAIEVDDYDEKEKLLHEIFSKSRVANTELFALDKNMVKELLLAFDGTVIYPENIDKDKEFDKVAAKSVENSPRKSSIIPNRKSPSERTDLYKKGIRYGEYSITHMIKA